MGLHKLPNGRWRVQVRRRNTPHVDRVFESREDAQALFDLITSQKRITGATIHQAWEAYRQDVAFTDLSVMSRRDHECHAKPILATLGDRTLQELEENPDIIKAFINDRARHVSKRTKKKLSLTTRRLELHTLTSIVKWAEEARWVRTNFMRLVKRPGRVRRKVRVAPDVTALLTLLGRSEDPEQPPSIEACRFVALLRYLACRPGELAKALRKDYDRDKRELILRDTKDTRGKGQARDRNVPVDPMALGLLDAQVLHARRVAKDSPYLFSTLPRSRVVKARDGWHPYNYSGAISRLRQGHYVPPEFHAHAMRREYVSRALESGLTHQEVMAQTGHRSYQSVELYNEALSTAPPLRAALDAHARDIVRELARALDPNPQKQLPSPPAGDLLSDEFAMMQAERAGKEIVELLRAAPRDGHHRKKAVNRIRKKERQSKTSAASMTRRRAA